MQKDNQAVLQDDRANVIMIPAEESDMEEIYKLYKEFAVCEKLEDYFSASLEEM